MAKQATSTILPPAILAARQYLGSKAYNELCQAFVEHVLGTGNRGGSAYQAWLNQQNIAQKGTQGLKPGDVMYFSPNSSNRGFGHTGIYEGNNKFISATDNGVQEYDLTDWQSATGQQVLGYIPHEKVGGQVNMSQNNPLTGGMPQQGGAVDQSVTMPQVDNQSGTSPGRALSFLPNGGVSLPMSSPSFGGGTNSLPNYQSNPLVAAYSQKASQPYIYSDAQALGALTLPQQSQAQQQDNVVVPQVDTTQGLPELPKPQTYKIGPITFTGVGASQ